MHLTVSRNKFFLSVITLYCLASQVSSQDTLRPGDRLNSSAQLVSANGIFSLGFFTPDGTNNSYIAVNYADEWGSDPVWIGNREQPASKNSDPVLSIDSSGKLIITHGRGEPIEIYAGGSGKNATATLSAQGNFIIEDLDSDGEVLWQSFDHPTDTLLPRMKLGINHKTGRNWTLTSWFSIDNPAPGAFSLEWDPISGRLLIRRRGVVYWTSSHMKDYDVHGTEGSLRVQGFETSYFHPDLDNANYNFTNVTSPDEEYLVYSLFRDPKWMPLIRNRIVISAWRLHDDGNLLDNRASRANGLALASNCYGNNNNKGEFDRGCELWEQPKCRKQLDKFVLRSGYFKAVNSVFETSTDDENSSLSLSDCRDICWRDCECVGYTALTDAGCSYWKGKSLEFEQSLDGSLGRKYVVAPTQSDKGKKNVIISIVVPSVALLAFGICLFIVLKIRKVGKREEELRDLLTLEGFTENYELENGGAKSDLRLFTYASIQSATKNFSSDHKLGQGGFGPVYKGKTPQGQDIAIKLLSQQSGQGLLEFKTELVLISKLQHVNLVKLLGFCIHGNDKMIVYDYVPNKSLDLFLFSSSKRELLDWPKRFKIIEGIAQGLLYLHRYSRLKIIHRDMKPSNILLDENMNPKISDFGLARIFKQNIDEANTERRVGTFGYMAPEYAMQGIFSVKSDVYSFGVLVLEIVSGQKNNCFHQMEGPLNLVEHAWDLWKTDSSLQLMDPSLSATCISHQLRRCIHVGLLCVENHAADRPTIEDALSMLKNETTNLPEPRAPAFITSRRNVVVGMGMERTTQQKIPSSANDLTISEIGGR